MDSPPDRWGWGHWRPRGSPRTRTSLDANLRQYAKLNFKRTLCLNLKANHYVFRRKYRGIFSTWDLLKISSARHQKYNRQKIKPIHRSALGGWGRHTVLTVDRVFYHPLPKGHHCRQSPTEDSPRGGAGVQTLGKWTAEGGAAASRRSHPLPQSGPAGLARLAARDLLACGSSRGRGCVSAGRLPQLRGHCRTRTPHPARSTRWLRDWTAGGSRDDAAGALRAHPKGRVATEHAADSVRKLDRGPQTRPRSPQHRAAHHAHKHPWPVPRALPGEAARFRASDAAPGEQKGGSRCLAGALRDRAKAQQAYKEIGANPSQALLAN